MDVRSRIRLLKVKLLFTIMVEHYVQLDDYVLVEHDLHKAT